MRISSSLCKNGTPGTIYATGHVVHELFECSEGARFINDFVANKLLLPEQQTRKCREYCKNVSYIYHNDDIFPKMLFLYKTNFNFFQTL